LGGMQQAVALALQDEPKTLEVRTGGHGPRISRRLEGSREV